MLNMDKINKLEATTSLYEAIFEIFKLSKDKKYIEIEISIIKKIFRPELNETFPIVYRYHEDHIVQKSKTIGWICRICQV